MDTTTTTTTTTIINNYDDDNHLPIHLLAMASIFPPEKANERGNACKCLISYLAARPNASADFLTAVQTLPDWLRDIAVISDHVQDVLDERIVMRFPTMILILDLTFFHLQAVLKIQFSVSPLQNPQDRISGVSLATYMETQKLQSLTHKHQFIPVLQRH
jgi:hypothetical protein